MTSDTAEVNTTFKHLSVPESAHRTFVNARTVRLVSTLPKSGTWALHYFWSTFDALLGDLREGDPFYPFWKFNNLGIDCFGIAHIFCPGWQTQMTASLKERWERLEPVVVGLDWGTMHMREAIGVPELNTTPDWRMVFMHRNALDQMLSYYRVYRRDIYRPGHRFVVKDRHGAIVPVETLGDFVRNIGLNSFVKYVLTFETAGAALGDKLMWVNYEDLMHRRAETILRIVSFLWRPLATDRETQIFQHALDLSSFERLSAIERVLGTSIGNGQAISEFFRSGARAIATSQRHLNDGKAGAWRTEYSTRDIDWCRGVLREFGLERYLADN